MFLAAEGGISQNTLITILVCLAILAILFWFFKGRHR